MKCSISILHSLLLGGTLCSCCLFGSCNPEEKETQAQILPKEVMIKVLADAHLAEAALQNYHGSKRDSLAILYYEQIFAIHGVRKEDFEYTYDQMRQQPEQLDEIYGEVMARLDSFRTGTHYTPQTIPPQR